MERERVMPYRPFIHYNSWYELNINRNNDSDPAKRMTEEQCLAVLKDWQEQFFQKRGMSIDAFVWDDGWDEFNSLWDFHKMFPQGFKRIDAAAGRQKAGIARGWVRWGLRSLQGQASRLLEREASGQQDRQFPAFQQGIF